MADENILQRIYVRIVRPETYPKNRRCKYPGCITVLNIYDGNDVCEIHKLELLGQGKKIGKRNYVLHIQRTIKHCKNISRALKKRWRKRNE